MEQKKHCPICKKQTDADIVNVCQLAQAWTIDQIKKDHPEWVKMIWGD